MIIVRITDLKLVQITDKYRFADVAVRKKSLKNRFRAAAS
jgi:hypothetical protein